MIDARSGKMVLVAGIGTRGNGAGGDPLGCELARPHGVFVDRDGAVFIGDTDNNRVRVIKSETANGK
jgi:hypothetical protein